MAKYLGFVVVSNLLETEHTDERKEEIENIINGSISSTSNGRFQATGKNMIYSFPLEPGLKDLEIPVMVDMRFLGLVNIGLNERDEMANLIRANLRLVFCRRGDVAVNVLNPGPTASFSPSPRD